MARERVGFKSREARDRFFNRLKELKDAKNWEELYRLMEVPRTMFQRYRYGQITIPIEMFELVCGNLQPEERRYFEKKVILKPANWGAVLGGVMTTKLHPEIFEFGRKKGTEKFEAIRKRNPAYNFDLDIPLSKELCEFIGAFIGDGFTNKYGRHYLIEITGDSVFDEEYLNYLAENVSRLFHGLKAHFSRVKNKRAIRLKFHSRQLFRLLTERFGFPKGLKCHSVRIPEEILNSSEENIFSTIRGIFDTDGCIFFDKRKVYLKPYPRISLQVVSRDLSTQLQEFLSRYFSIHKGKNRQNYFTEIYGQKQFEVWMSLIGFSNQRHLNRIEKAISLWGDSNPRPLPYQGNALKPLRHRGN